ncbi:uncharacterized protein LOC110094863 isoform X2 [Dendrobium catenatum]|uniref:uncharacterized protein LOC110094863 isoform X2 n=1 Tax=Dendrobium catenatum TaxID=906689 RepID=UPI0009F4B4E1|nr:uncharacterized protein LOC110094863 isoform X2 [Dendrobium catenatum]
MITTPSRYWMLYRSKHPFKQSSTPPLRCNYSVLHEWRNGPINENRSWGPAGPQPSELRTPTSFGDDSTASFSSLADYAALILSTPDPLLKSRLSHLAFSRWSSYCLPVGVVFPPDRPARPARPILVPPREIQTHKSSGLPLNAYLLHNLAHVELNAIDLAWDTVARFSPLHDLLGDEFFSDFARVADDESRHFAWCSQRLTELGFRLLQEARGLDAGPRLVQKLIGFGDHKTSNIVAMIAEEEVAHVAVGVFWFTQLCQKMGRTPCDTFKDLLKCYSVELKGPFNYAARDKAGIPRDWYDDDSLIQDATRKRLSEVHDRLATIISMEQESSKLG